MAIEPSGVRLAVAGFQCVRMYDLTVGKPLIHFVFEACNKNVSAVGFRVSVQHNSFDEDHSLIYRLNNLHDNLLFGGSIQVCIL
jgi:hypothetical protein